MTVQKILLFSIPVLSIICYFYLLSLLPKDNVYFYILDVLCISIISMLLAEGLWSIHNKIFNRYMNGNNVNINYIINDIVDQVKKATINELVRLMEEIKRDMKNDTKN